jgi:hypothetical protein
MTISMQGLYVTLSISDTQYERLCHYAVLRFIYYYIECLYVECLHANCHYAECHYANCHYA